MEREINLYGKSSKNGKPIISGLERFHKIFEDNPDKRFFIQVTIEEPGTVNHHVWYIMKIIVPAFIKGYQEKGVLLTPETAILEISAQCPIFYKKRNEFNSIFDFSEYKPKCTLQPFELEAAIEWLHKFCLDNFNLVIGNTKILK